MSTDKQVHLLDDLQNLLEKQIELTQHGNISDVEVLSRQASSIAERIAETGILELAEFKNRRDKLRKLYDSLCLAITAQTADITGKLSRIHKGKKTVRTYRNNI